MGQQQLLLTILVTIIVGIATIVAITVFQEFSEQNRVEGMRQQLLEAVSIAQTYYKKPAAIGGGGGSFQQVTLNILNLDSANEYGTYTIENKGSESVTLLATSKFAGDSLVLVIYEDQIVWQ